MLRPFQTIRDRARLGLTDLGLTRFGLIRWDLALGRTLAAVLLVVGLNLLLADPAQALIQVKLADVHTQECPPELAEGMVTSGGLSMPAHCYLIVGKADNTSGKVVFDADIFGRVYDADNNSVLENRTRLGMIDRLEPGISDFSIRISVPESQAGNLQLKQFKASGFANASRFDQSGQP